MANQDLQILYKMREILRREEYTKHYNSTLDVKYKKDIEAKTNEYDRKLKPIPPVEPKPVFKPGIEIDFSIPDIALGIIIALVLLAAYIAVTLILQNKASEKIIFLNDPSYNFMGEVYVLATAVWGCLAIFFVSLIYGDLGIAIGPSVLSLGSLVFGIIEIVNIFNMLESNGMLSSKSDWTWTIVMLVLWPVCLVILLLSLRPVGFCLVIVLSMVGAAVLIICLSFFTDIDEDIDVNIPITKGRLIENEEAKAKYKIAFADYQQEMRIFEQERKVTLDSEQKSMQLAYQKLKKVDNYSADKKAMLSEIPSSMQNLQTINEIIWCIEQKYARDIVEARQWCRTEKHYEIMEKCAVATAAGIYNLNKIQAQAAADANKNAKAMLAAIDRQTERIDVQTDAINNQSQKIEEQTGAIREQTGAIREQNRKIEKQTDAIKEQTRDINAQTSAIEKQTAAVKDQANTIHNTGNRIESELRNSSPTPVIYYNNN